MQLKITTMNKLFVVALMNIAGAVNAAPAIYNGGISLDKTEKLAQTSIPLPNGRPDTVLALAMRHGHARGHFTGKAAAAIKQKYKKDIPIYVEAVRKETVAGKPGCNKVQLTFKTSREFEQIAPQQSVDVEVCPNPKH